VELLISGNEELIESLLFDAEATRGAVSSWIKENWDETAGYITSSRYNYIFCSCSS